MTRVCEKAEAISLCVRGAVEEVVAIAVAGSRCPRLSQPGLHFLIRFEAVVVSMRELPNTNDARVGVLVVPIPEPALSSLLRKVAEGVGNEFDGGGGVRDEY